ncbi:uncharacterized protein LOC141907450 isoform X2 [Tubulanus polymorphus]|uniref:uncharacterized protein LOC141907450 isoform X2 n=1 Tax=Tubulanus polymorphus TaxID=672921 RepID=UPI003DA58F89
MDSLQTPMIASLILVMISLSASDVKGTTPTQAQLDEKKNERCGANVTARVQSPATLKDGVTSANYTCDSTNTSGGNRSCYCLTPGTSLKMPEYQFPHSERLKSSCVCARAKFSFCLTGMVGLLFDCRDDGDYKSTKCKGSECFCSDRRGNIDTGTGVNIGQLDVLEKVCANKNN